MEGLENIALSSAAGLVSDADFSKLYGPMYIYMLDIVSHLVARRPEDPRKYILAQLQHLAVAKRTQAFAARQRAALDRAHVVCLWGGPGSGKSTQAKMILAELPEAENIDVEELLNEEVDKGSDLGLKVEELRENKAPIPDTILQDLVIPRIVTNSRNKKVTVLQGYPSSPQQATILLDHVRPRKFLYFKSDNQTMTERLVESSVDGYGARSDDAKPRIAAFQASRNGVLDAMANCGGHNMIHEIDASGSIDDVYANVRVALSTCGLISEP